MTPEDFLAAAKAEAEAMASKDPDPEYVPEGEPAPELPPGCFPVDSQNSYTQMAGVCLMNLPAPARWRQDWYLWDGSRYAQTSVEELRAIVWPLLERCHVWSKKLAQWVAVKPSCGSVTNVLEALASLPGVMQPSEAQAPFRRGGQPLCIDTLTVFTNGSLDVSDDRFAPAESSMFNLHRAETELRRNATCPGWIAFLDQQWKDEPKSKELLQEWFGYCLTNWSGLHKMLFLKGPRRSGKGTILRVLKALLGRSYVDFDANSLHGDFGLEVFVNNTVAGDGDVRWGHDNAQRVIGRLLKLSGGDGVNVGRKNKTDVTISGIKLLFFGNEWPMVNDRTGALGGRLLLLEHTRSFYGSEDEELAARLIAELPGIARWAIDGLKRLRLNGRFTVATVQDSAQAEIVDAGNPVLRFLRDELRFAAGAWVSSADLRKAYENSMRALGRGVLSEENFGKELRAYAKAEGAELDRAQRRSGGRLVRGYTGLALVDDGAVIAISDRDVIREWLDNPRSSARDIYGHLITEAMDKASGFSLTDVLEHVLKIPRERHPQHEHRVIRVLEHLGYVPLEDTGRYCFRVPRAVPAWREPGDDQEELYLSARL